jgi:8-oxo-dGTP diphosphatase
LQSGLRMILVQEQHLEKTSLINFAKKVIRLARPYGAKVFISEHIELARELRADGVHLTSQSLLMLSAKPTDIMVAATCHQAEELKQAEALDLDFVLLSPLKSTLNQPEAEPLGWEVFSDMIRDVTLPVYAFGGITLTDLPVALSYGARGVAFQRGDKAKLEINLA